MKTRMQEGIENRHARERNAALRDQADAMHRRAKAEERSAKALERLVSQMGDLTERVARLEEREPASRPCVHCNGDNCEYCAEDPQGDESRPEGRPS